MSTISLPDLTDTFAASPDVVAREVGNELVLLDLESGRYFGLDAVGGLVWELLGENARSLAELCDAIEAAFDAPRETIEADLIALAADMREKGLIVPQQG